MSATGSPDPTGVTEVRVDVPGPPGRAYAVHVERGALDGLGEACAAVVSAHRWAVIADSRVAELYGGRVLAILRAAGLEADGLVFPAGEWNKSAEAWVDLHAGMLAAGMGRDAAVVALGGGVTGDLAGFVAATFMRGIPIVHVPTTVLSMVDSAIGGKTGIDVAAAKNAVGAFHHPALVLVDPGLLETLPAFHRVAGLAEAVKTAAVRDEGLLVWIEAKAAALRDGEPEALTELVGRCVEAKARVVAEDPEETGIRAVLNFGHTAGHALESLSGFSLLHGEAVAEGMRLEAALGEAMGITEEGTAARIDAALVACGLPDVLDDDATPEAILEAARSDKKARRGAPRWSLLRRPGEPARDEGGSYTRLLETDRCVEGLATALRAARKAADSRA